MTVQPVLNSNQFISFKRKHVKSKQQPAQMQYGLGLYDAPTMEYSKPVRLKKALYDVIGSKELNEGVVGEKATIYRFLRDLSKQDKDKILDKKVVKLNGYGSVAAAFFTPNGEVIKLSDGNHFPMNRPQEFFDSPVVKRGHSGNTYYYVTEQLYQHNMPEALVEDVRNMIKQAGYRVFDLGSSDVFQIGLSKNGKVYLLDPECAKYKTIFHALFDKAKQLIRKKV